MANEIRNEELAPADIEILGWRIMHGEATSFEREVAGKIILDAAAKRREPAPLSERAEPKERLARITVRNPNLMRAITVEICGKETKLNAGESVDLALAEITNLRRDMERGMANHNADLNTAGSSRPFITRLALENGGMVDVDLSDGTNLPFTEWTKFTTWLMDRDGTPASRSHVEDKDAYARAAYVAEATAAGAVPNPNYPPPSIASQHSCPLGKQCPTPNVCDPYCKETGVPSSTEAITAEKDEAYRQRNVLVAALARLFPSGIRKTSIAAWSEDWHGCVYIDLPAGQISYHYHDSQAHLFDGLPPYEKHWDGHDKETVEKRLAALRSAIEKQRDAIIERCAVVCEQTHSGDAVRAERRTCTCHPDERPTPCQQKFALNDCRAAAALSKPGDGGRA